MDLGRCTSIWMELFFLVIAGQAVLTQTQNASVTNNSDTSGMRPETTVSLMDLLTTNQPIPTLPIASTNVTANPSSPSSDGSSTVTDTAASSVDTTLPGRTAAATTTATAAATTAPTTAATTTTTTTATTTATAPATTTTVAKASASTATMGGLTTTPEIASTTPASPGASTTTSANDTLPTPATTNETTIDTNSTETVNTTIIPGNDTDARNCSSEFIDECLEDLADLSRKSVYGVPSYDAQEFRKACSKYHSSSECRDSLIECVGASNDLEDIDDVMGYLCRSGYDGYRKNVKCFSENRDVSYAVGRCLKGYNDQMKEIQYNRLPKTKKLAKMCTHTNYYVWCTSRQIRSKCNDVAADLVIDVSRIVLGEQFKKGNYDCKISSAVGLSGDVIHWLCLAMIAVFMYDIQRR